MQYDTGFQNIIQNPLIYMSSRTFTQNLTSLTMARFIHKKYHTYYIHFIYGTAPNANQSDFSIEFGDSFSDRAT